MLSDAFAEWVVRRWTSQRRAASIVGDLVELRPQKGSLWFWMALAGAVLRLAWRPILATVAGFYAGAYALSFFQMAIWGIRVQHHPAGYAWTPVFSVFNGGGAIVCLVLVYAAIRYGVRDRLTQLAVVLAGLCTPIAYLWWKPVVLITCIALIAGVLAASLLDRAWRRAASILAVVTAAGCAGGLLALYLASQYQRFVYAGPWGDKEMRMHPSVLWVTFLLMFATGWLLMALCARMHRRLFESHGPDGAMEEGVAELPS